MSRNLKSSESPDLGLEESLYEASPAPNGSRRREEPAPGSENLSPPPGASNSSDKENQAAIHDKAHSRSNMPPPDTTPRLSEEERPGKRKRGAENLPQSRPVPRSRTRDLGEDEDSLYYDPDQDVDERRRIRRGLRDLTRNINENRNEYLTANSRGLYDTVKEANELSKSIKQTVDATIDSRLLVTAADLSYKRTVQLTLGNSAQGVDIDEFVSKCITFMRKADSTMNNSVRPPPNSTQQRRARRAGLDDEHEDDGDEGDMLNWESLGRMACTQHNLRPATPGFLLGPLSLEKRARKTTVRRAGLKASNYVQTQPEVLKAGDIEKAENANLIVLCGRILSRLYEVQRDGIASVEKEHNDDMSDAEIKALMDKYGLHETGGVDLFKFVVNPHSFGQTVENMFYVSFLIRDGKVGISMNEGLPSLGRTNSSNYTSL
jgi:hypothetical protein